jgi:hypothetical protein
VALRVEHYDVCLSAKIAQLQDIFAAKIGWAVGNIYSRVGTPDIEEKLDNAEEYKREFFRDSLEPRAIWLSTAQFRLFNKAVSNWKRNNPGQSPSLEIIIELVGKLEKDMELISDRAVAALQEAGVFKPDGELRARARNVLINDPALQRLIKTSSL